MLCEKCGKYAATTHIRSVVNGVVIEKNLCDSCAANEGLGVIPQNPIGSMLASMFGEVLESKPQNMKRCPVCGATFKDIAESGKAGCADCYKTFKAEFLPYLKRIHGSTKHIGSIPLTYVTEKDSILELREELSRLISEENYEQAAVVRDKIKSLEAGKNE